MRKRNPSRAESVKGRDSGTTSFALVIMARRVTMALWGSDVGISSPLTNNCLFSHKAQNESHYPNGGNVQREIKESLGWAARFQLKGHVNNHWKCDELEVTVFYRILLRENTVSVRSCLRHGHVFMAKLPSRGWVWLTVWLCIHCMNMWVWRQKIAQWSASHLNKYQTNVWRVLVWGTRSLTFLEHSHGVCISLLFWSRATSCLDAICKITSTRAG